MEMQDKEFDQLFNSKLKDFEMEPSAMVWDNIANELDGKKEPKRSIVPYWGIAASVIIVIAASVLLFNRNIRKDDDQPVKLVRHPKPVKPSFVDSNNAPVEAADGLNQLAIATTPISENQPVSNKSENKENIVKVATVKAAVPETVHNEPLLVAANVETAPVLKPAAPVNDIDLGIATLVNQPKPIMDPPVGVIVDPIAEDVKPKKRAHGLGGLINTIVAAVDKREDKLIEFADSENDEGTKVAAVNLGIFKIKKQ